MLDVDMPEPTLYGQFYVFRVLSEADRYGRAGEALEDWAVLLDGADLTTPPE